MKRRILSLLLAVILALSVIPAVAAAETGLSEESGAAVETALPTEELPTEDATEAPAGDITEAPVAEIIEEAPAVVGDLPTEPAEQPVVVEYPEIINIYPSKNGVTVCWSAYDGAAKYAVFIKNGDNSWKRLGFAAATSYEHVITPDGTPYTYTVRAVGGNEKYISGYDRTGVEFSCLPAPKLTRIDNVVGGQRLIWEPADTDRDVRYRAYIKGDNGWTAVNDTYNTRYINRDAVSGETITYTVRCIDPATGKPLSFYDRRGITATYVAAPEIHNFYPANGGVTFRWSRVTGAAGYAVFFKENDTWKKLGVTDDISYTHTKLTNDTLYTYTVRCTDAKGKYLSSFNPTGWSYTYYAPPKFTHVSASDNKPVLIWSGSDAYTSYKLFRKPFLGKWTEIARTPDTSYTDASAAANTLYTYTVRGLDQNGMYLTYYTDTFVYYVNGVRANGKYTVNGASFRFSNGKLVPGYYTVNKRVYYYNADITVQKNGIVGSKTAGYTYADKNGVCCTSQEIRLAAEYMMKYCTGSTLQQKAKTGFLYMAKHFPYRRSYNHPTKAADIPALAIDMFTKESGNCFRYAACFACLAKIAGYRVRMVIGTTGGSPHGWTEVLVNGKWLICDPDAQLPGYGMPDYYAYMMTRHFWQLSPRVKCELTIDANGKAVWK